MRSETSKTVRCTSDARPVFRNADKLFFLYSDLSREVTEDLLRSWKRPSYVRSILANAIPSPFSSDQDSLLSKNKLLSDFHYNNFALCIEIQLSAAQTSAYLSLMNYILHSSFPIAIGEDASIENGMTSDRWKALNASESFEKFKREMLRHCHHRPPFSIGVFSFHSFEALMRETVEIFYSHYSLYHYAFTNFDGKQWMPRRVSTTVLKKEDDLEVNRLQPVEILPSD